MANVPTLYIAVYGKWRSDLESGVNNIDIGMAVEGSAVPVRLRQLMHVAWRIFERFLLSAVRYVRDVRDVTNFDEECQSASC